MEPATPGSEIVILPKRHKEGFSNRLAIQYRCDSFRQSPGVQEWGKTGWQPGRPCLQDTRQNIIKPMLTTAKPANVGEQPLLTAVLQKIKTNRNRKYWCHFWRGPQENTRQAALN